MSDDDKDIEEAHLAAVQRGSMTYVDPKTGFTVFTELAHLTRGTCCGNKCRHCPYGWQMVVNNNGDVDDDSKKALLSSSRPRKLRSGDFETAKRLVEDMTMSQTNKESFNPAVRSSTTRATSEAQQSAGPKSTGGRKGGKYTTKNVPYTRQGDKGTSQLLTGERRSKADDVFEAMGTVDELCSVVGVVHAELETAASSVDNNANNEKLYGDLPEWLLDVMSRLFDLGSHVAKPKQEDSAEFRPDGVGGGFAQSHIDQLEDWIDVMTNDLPELVSFILPTGSKGAAQLQVARTVCRRAERRVVALVNDGVSDPNGMRYLNRLSDFFFTAARWVNYREGREEITYRREFRGAKQRTRQSVSLIGKQSEQGSEE